MIWNDILLFGSFSPDEVLFELREVICCCVSRIINVTLKKNFFEKKKKKAKTETETHLDRISFKQ
jgi:hypothetical protein